MTRKRTYPDDRRGPHQQLAVDNIRAFWRAMDTIGRPDLYSGPAATRKHTPITAFTHAAAQAGCRVTVIVEPILDPKEDIR